MRSHEAVTFRTRSMIKKILKPSQDATRSWSHTVNSSTEEIRFQTDHHSRISDVGEANRSSKGNEVILLQLADVDHSGIKIKTSSSKGSEKVMTEDTEDEGDGPSTEIDIEAMEKAQFFLSKYKNTNHFTANPTSTKSWLIHTISTIIQTPGNK